MILKFFEEFPLKVPFVEEMIECNIFICDFDVQEGDYIGELARRILEDFTKQL